MRVAEQRESGIEVETLPGEELRGLVEASGEMAYRYCPGIGAAARVDYVLSSLAQAQRKGALTHVFRDAGQPDALLQVEQLPWDSKILGFPAGRIAWWLDKEPNGDFSRRENLLRASLRAARSAGVRYLVARIRSSDRGGAQLLERNGFELVDALLTFGLDMAEFSAAPREMPGSVRCERWAADDLPALCEIAASSFIFDRFHGDPAVGRVKADELHVQWLEDSCAGFADAVLVAHGDEPMGFTTLKVDKLAQAVCGVAVGTIVLVATSIEHRRKGIARSLTLAAVHWFRKAGCAWVEVATQLANVPASRVYQSAGFQLVGSSLTFRRLL